MRTLAEYPALADIDVRSVMAPGLVTCPPGAALTEVAVLMTVHQVHSVVVDPEAPRLITARDVVRGMLAGVVSADDTVASEPPSAAPDESLQTVAERMLRNREGHIVVRDDGDGRACGVVSSFDIVAVLAGHEPRVARIVRPMPARPALSGGFGAHAVRDVMHRGLITCAPDASLTEVATALVERRSHTALVWADAGLAFVTDLDLVAAALRGDPAPTAVELASPGLAIVRADAPLAVAAPIVAENPVGHVIAVDEQGFPVGVVSTLDLVRAIDTG
ncbi:MAG TPA: CBS domain-containing protein [Solirubrobacteraceae bacterium]|jgi:CBS domain-containing protein